MTPIPTWAAQRACDLANAHIPDCVMPYLPMDVRPNNVALYALALHIMEFDAYKRDVSDAINAADASPMNGRLWGELRRFVIAEPDPAREAVKEALQVRFPGLKDAGAYADTDEILAALSRRGLEVRPVGEVGNV